MATTLALFCAAIVGVSLLGGLLPLATVLTHTRLQVYLSFSAGAMLGAAFFHMMPEAVRLGSAGTLRWAAVGLLALFFLERFFAFHHHEAPADPAEPCPTHPHEHAPAARATRRAWSIPRRRAGGSRRPRGRRCTGGPRRSAWPCTRWPGGWRWPAPRRPHAAGTTAWGAAAWGVFLATIVHKPADALTIVSLMLRAGAPRPRAHLVNLAFALMIPLGVALFFVGSAGSARRPSASLTAAALAFSAGTFLCIALSDLLPELQFHAHDRLSLSVALLAGVGLMAATAAWEPGDSHKPPAHQHDARPVP